MQRTAVNLSLLYKHIKASFQGLIAAHVEGTLRTVTKAFQTETNATAKRFDTKRRIYDNLTFTGVSIDTNDNGCWLVHQCEYEMTI